MDQVQELKTMVSQVSTEVMGFAQDIGRKISAHGARIDELEQRVVRGQHSGGSISSPMTGGGSSLGAFVVRDARVQSLISSPGKRGRVTLSVPSDMAAITTVSVGGRDVLVAPDRAPGISAPLQRRLTIRALLAPGRTTSNTVSYIRETGFTNNAAVVSEGQTKPQSDLDFELATANVATIAHWVEASKQILDDAPVLENHIDTRLRYGLAFKEEQEILFGDGTGEHPYGLVPQATAYVAPFAPVAPTMLDELGLAVAQAEAAEYPVTGIIVNSLDWRRMTMLKNANNDYLGGGPFGAGIPSIWGIDIVPTNSMTEGSYLLGAFGLAAQLWDRQETTVDISTESGDSFVRNMVVIRCESRFALTVARPEALIFGQFTATT